MVVGVVGVVGGAGAGAGAGGWAWRGLGRGRGGDVARGVVPRGAGEVVAGVDLELDVLVTADHGGRVVRLLLAAVGRGPHGRHHLPVAAHLAGRVDGVLVAALHGRPGAAYNT